MRERKRERVMVVVLCDGMVIACGNAFQHLFVGGCGLKILGVLGQTL